VFEVIEECLKDQCLCREQFYLNTLTPRYNIYKIAGSPRGRIVSNETKQKISKTLTGRKMSESQKLKISKSLKDKPKSPEHILKVKEAIKGKQKHEKHSGFSGYYRFKNKHTNQELICARYELVDKFGLDPSRLSKVCNGQRTHHKGWMCIEKEVSYEALL